jgi:alkanesulfonate monooxygenase SsuD/methylene tetrahydromethanopterin reductase-like flavin-dependent oxidoreductase (luciferase family)
MKHAIDVGPFNELADPRVVAGLAARAEERGWDGFFVWDHIVYSAPVRAVADPWVTLAAVACATSRVLIGPMVTPLSRRRVHKVARETVTLDLLSSGRLVFGVGLGSTRHGELEQFGEVTDARERARLLDDGWMPSPGTGPGSSNRSRYSGPGPRCGWLECGRTVRRCAGRCAGTASSPSTCPAPGRWPNWPPRSAKPAPTAGRST